MKINNYEPTTGRLIAEDGTTANIVDLLGGGEAVSGKTYNINNYAPRSGRVIGEDGKLYNLVELLGNQTEAAEQNAKDIAALASYDTTLRNYFALQRTGKIYQRKVWKFEVNQTSDCPAMRDLIGLVCEPSTDTVEGRDDFADIPLFQWWRCNYVRDKYGLPYITAIKGEEHYAETGSVDVGSFGMTFYWNYEDCGNYYLLTISDSPNAELGLVPWAGSVRHDGSIAPYWCESAYASVIASDGLLRSQSGKPARNQSYANMITNYAKKGEGYFGAGARRQTLGIVFQIIKYGTKNSQNVFAGCTSRNVQYEAAVMRDTNDTYFPVTAAQAEKIEIGCCVSVGYADNNNGALNKDRDADTLHKYADNVRIIKIEDMADGNTAVYLDVAEGFNTLPVALTDELSSPVIMSSMLSLSGETDFVMNKHDGSMTSCTNGKHSYRIQGIEYSNGAYVVAADTVMVSKFDYSKDVYVAPIWIERITSEATIKDTYTLIGNIPAAADGADFWIGDVGFDLTTGSWYPRAIGGGSSIGTGDKCYAEGKMISGIREYLQGGNLWDTSGAGSSCLSCRNGLSASRWYFCGSD